MSYFQTFLGTQKTAVLNLNEETPLFTVVIPVYNRAYSVVRSIDSILSQYIKDFEILVIDDGSTDEIGETMSRYPDVRIRLIRQPNRGASAARNHGIDLARGRYIALLDSDDSFLPHHLSTMKELLAGRDDVIVYAPVRAQRGTGFIVKPPRAIAPSESMATYLMCGRGFVQTSGLVIPTEIARKVRYREDASFGDDTDFAIRLQLAGFQFLMAPEPGVDWFDGPDPARLSNIQIADSRLAWLEDLRPRIPRRAYLGYRGWHVAKFLIHQRPFQALGLYFEALLGGSYPAPLALVVLAQILAPSAVYRDVSDKIVGLMGFFKSDRQSKDPA